MRPGLQQRRIEDAHTRIGGGDDDDVGICWSKPSIVHQNLVSESVRARRGRRPQPAINDDAVQRRRSRQQMSDRSGASALGALEEIADASWRLRRRTFRQIRLNRSMLFLSQSRAHPLPRAIWHAPSRSWTDAGRSGPIMSTPPWGRDAPTSDKLLAEKARFKNSTNKIAGLRLAIFDLRRPHQKRSLAGVRRYRPRDARNCCDRSSSWPGPVRRALNASCATRTRQ